MAFNLNSKILLSVASIAAAAALIIGATFAFFSDSETSTGNTFAAGTLEIDILDQNEDTPFETEVIVSNWAPGDETLVNFDVKNIGTLPINIRGFATGSWGDDDLDALNVVKVTKVERFSGGWEELASDPDGITGLFYYSPTGGDVDLFEVPPDARAQFRLTVEFDEDAGNDFQEETFTSSLTVEAKQTTAPSWPI